MKKISIAIDGPAGAGKSTTARLISKELGIAYLDTGAMYRAVALKAKREGIDTCDAEKLSSMVKNINLSVEYENREQRIYLDGEEVSGQIRTAEISVGASNVGAVPAVRLRMVELQREIAQKYSVVMDGRDIGSYVLPDAEFKFFLTASVEARVRRRFAEHVQKGSSVKLDEVFNDIEYRDKNDSTRTFAPLCKASDAIEIDTTGLNVRQAADIIMTYVRRG